VTSVLDSPPTTAPRREPEPLQRRMWWPAIELLGSMRVAVVLLLYLGLLTFIGTFAQVEWDAFTTQKNVFEAWIAKAPALGPLRIPGGLPTMILLFVNLLVGGVLRMRWRWRKAGILVTHFGMLLLLAAGWVKYSFSVSGFVALYETESDSVFVSFTENELALVQQDGDRVTERVVPETVLERAGAEPLQIATGDLPFDLSVSHWCEDARAIKAPMVDAGGMPKLDGAFLRRTPDDRMPVEKEKRFAGCYARVVERRTGAVHEAMLSSFEQRPILRNIAPWTFTVDGRRYGLMLRRRVFDMPFGVRLKSFVKHDHPGTDTPSDYSSYVSVLEPEGERSVHIFMNNPLRRDGLVVYQTSWGRDPFADPATARLYSVFEVARNPSDKWPECACWVILAGLLLHFGVKLWFYIRSQERAHARGVA
jgi:hypothetical protein